MAFWIAAAALSALVAALVVLGALRGRDTGAGRENVEVYREQLREVDKDVARGTLSGEEAERLRLEISRRLLEADRGAGPGAAASDTPRAAFWGAVAVVLVLVAGSFALYARIGSPGYSDMPLAGRLEAAREARANRPAQAAAEAERNAAAEPEDEAEAEGEASESAELVAQLRTLLADRPDDLRGHRLLVSSAASIGEMTIAHEAQARVIAILGDEATADDYVMLADLMISAAGGYVSPEAENALEAALERAPDHPVARYFTGVMMAQTGRPDVAFRLWRRLLDEGPADAPWVAPIRTRIEGLAARAGVRYTLPPAGAAEPGRGPSAAEIEAAQDMPPEERREMIRDMVSRLSARLANEGGTAGDWAQLITAYGVLGETEQAGAIWNEALVLFGDRPGDLEQIRSAARDAGLVQ